MAKTEEVKEILAGRRVLIVEDDEGLTERLGKEFKRFGADEVAIRFTVEGGLKELKEKGSEYDLIVVDVMLPETQEDFMQIQGLTGQLKKYQKILKQEDTAHPGDQQYQKDLAKARERWRPLNKVITSLIRKEGGIEMVSEWLGALQDASRPPILYLTALGGMEHRMHGIGVTDGKDVEWLVKPVTVDTLMHTAGGLIRNCRIGRAAGD